ncbi:29384_t:CDS:1, partial [Racocetra persica]
METEVNVGAEVEIMKFKRQCWAIWTFGLIKKIWTNMDIVIYEHGHSNLWTWTY